jgi:hypothetical protein
MHGTGTDLGLGCPVIVASFGRLADEVLEGVYYLEMRALFPRTVFKIK